MFGVLFMASMFILSTTALLNESFAAFLGSLSLYYNRQAEGRGKWEPTGWKNTGKLRTAADFVKKWFLKQIHERGKKQQTISSVSYILLHNDIRQNRLPRWKNPLILLLKTIILNLSSLTIKLTKKNGGGILF